MKRLLCILNILLLLLLCGCAPSQPRAQIAATTLPVYELTFRLCDGTGLTVTQLVTEAVSCLHDYSLNVRQVRAADASGDWRALKLDLAVMKEVEAAYGEQTWTHPYAHALYWARAGLEIARDPVVRRELRQIVYQTLIMETRQDPRFAVAALREMKAAYQEAPVMGLKDVMEKFRARYALPVE